MNGGSRIDIADDIVEPVDADPDDQAIGVFGDKQVELSNLTVLQYREMQKVLAESQKAKSRLYQATKSVNGVDVDVWVSKRTVKGALFL